MITNPMESTLRDRNTDRYAPCLTRLRGWYARLTEAERRAADYLLASPGEAMLLSITEVARAGAVGTSTVTRLCTKLGYNGFSDMKTALAVELLSPAYGSPAPIGEDDSVGAIIRKVLDFGVQSLKDTATLLDEGAMGRAAMAIARCRRVECYAAGNVTGPIADIAQHRLLGLGVSCAAFTRGEQAATASLLGPGDVALGLSNSGVAVTVAAALEAARSVGATTIAITYAPDSPVARAADICLLTATRETHVWSDAVASRLPMLAVLDTLYACVALLRRRTTGAASSEETPTRTDL